MLIGSRRDRRTEHPVVQPVPSSLPSSSPSSLPTGSPGGLPADRLTTPGVETEHLGDVLLVRAPGTREDVLRAFAESAPAEPGVLTVLAGTGGGLRAGDVLSALRPVLAELRRQGYHSARLILQDAGREPAGHERPVVRNLAEASGMTVIGPVGAVVQVPGGTLFPRTAAGAGTWRRFRPGRPAGESIGPWWPAARWRTLLAHAPVDVVDGVRIHAVPAGLCLTSAQVAQLPPDDVAYCVPVDPQRPLVLIHGGAGPVPTPGQLAGALQALPTGLRASARLAPLGPVGDAGWPQEVADRLGAELYTLTGIPLLTGDEVSVCVLADQDTISWRPQAVLLGYRPSGGTAPREPRTPLVREWRLPGKPLPAAGPAVYRMDRDWVVEVVAAGLWLRPAGRVGWPAGRLAPPDPAAATLIVGLTDRPVSGGVSGNLWNHIDELLSRLATEGGAGRLVVLGPAGEDARTQAADAAWRFGLTPEFAADVTGAGAGRPVAALPKPGPVPRVEVAPEPEPEPEPEPKPEPEPVPQPVPESDVWSRADVWTELEAWSEPER